MSFSGFSSVGDVFSSIVTNFLSLFERGGTPQQPPVQQPPIQQPPVTQDPVQVQPLQPPLTQPPPVTQDPVQVEPVQQTPTQPDPPQGQQPEPTQPQPVQPTAVVSTERTAFLDRFAKLSESLDKIDERVKKLASPPAAITDAVKAATLEKPIAEKAGDIKPENWPAATVALDELQKKIDAVGTACLDEATKAANAFDVRFVAKDKNKPAGKAIIPKYIAYGKVKKTLDGLITSKDGIGAMEAGPATETALADFEKAASPSTTDKQTSVTNALSTLKGLSDEDLGKKTLQEQAELALELCANGLPSGSGNKAPIPGSDIEQLCRLYAKSKPDPKFMEKRAKEREKIADEVVKMEEIKKLYKSDGSLDADYWSDLCKDSNKTLALMQKICDVQADAMNMKKILVFKDPDPPVKNGTMGGYNPATNNIGLNFFAGYLKPVSEAIDTIIHETFHAHQDVIVKRLKAGDIGPGDDDYPTALMYMVNDIPVGYVFEGGVGNTNYKTQPTEFDSFHHAGETVTDLMGKAKKSAQGTTS